MVEIGVLGVFAGIAVAIAFFLGYYLIGHLRHKNAALVWLGLSVLAIGIRVAKSIVYFILNDMAPIGLSLAFFALASIGPFYLIYTKAAHDKQFQFKPAQLLHFVVPLMGALACYMVTPDPLETTFYQTATLLLGGYIGWAHWKHYRFTYENLTEQQWNGQTLVLLWGVWGAFVFQHIAGSMIFYAYGAIIAALFIFYLFGKVLKQPPVFQSIRPATVPDTVLEKVKESFENDHVYLAVGMSVNVLAGQIDVPAYQITKAVRVLYNKTFPEALSFFRVEAFKARIAKEEHLNLTIECLAERSGFKTTSSFYNAFKKETGQTPTSYMESLQLRSA